MIDSSQLLIFRLDNAKDLPLPSRGSPLSSGLDIRANVYDYVIINPGERKSISAGIKIICPRGHEAQIRPRSGLALREGLTILNSPATIDEDFRGELHVLVINHGEEPVTINRGDRFAQMVICPVNYVKTSEIDEDMFSHFDNTERGSSGYGSTGVK